MKDNYTNSDSLEFRVTYDRAQKNDQKCKTVVKIEPQYMQRLGIRQGDVVKISGNTKSTAAACLAITPQELKEIKETSPDLEIEYVNNPKKKPQLAPKAIIYGPVSCNIDPSYD